MPDYEETADSAIVAPSPVQPPKRGPGRPRLAVTKSPRREKKLDIKEQWSIDFAALTPERQKELLNLQERVDELNFFITDVVRGVPYGRGTAVAGDPNLSRGMVYPDLSFRMVQDFLKDFPPVNSQADPENAKEFFALEGDSWDDENYKKFGIRTRLWSVQLKDFYINVKIYCQAHPEDCEDGVLSEVTTIVEFQKPDWQKRLDAERQAEQEQIELRKQSNVKGVAKAAEHNVSHQEKDREEERRQAQRFLGAIRDGEREIIGGF